ncbi:histidine phosphatase family protein [Mammaliicoccus vitulinus]|uniref:histidine phosphatase family protein n=1 Tax=Mammaliicoccus vitulinus TaxID=71237 RepID=UPI003BA2ADF3
MFYLLRHCKALGQDTDADLTSEGAEIAQSISKNLEDLKIEKIYSSPMKRAIKTVEPFAIKNNMEVNIDSRLSERVLTRENTEDFLFYLKKSFSDYKLKFEGGESSEEALARAMEVLNEISTDENILIVSHGNLIALILNNFEKFGYDDWKELKNPDLWEIDNNGSIRRITL